MTFRVLPILLAVTFAGFWYPLTSTGIVGWGEDPYFNLWTLEVVWKNLTDFGILRIFAREFWETPIFHPFPITLALSENQIIPGILSWPIRHFTQNGAFAYNASAFLMSLATFFFTWRWLEEIGVRRYSLWGGLLFQACGWIQDQYAHFQNICIFVFPLALYSWVRLSRNPSLSRLMMCGFCFGWVIGWNVYYQVFLNFIFFVLISKAFIRGEISRAKLLFLGAIVFCVEFPFAYQYLKLESFMGSFQVSSGEYVNNSASLLSVFSHAHSISLLQKLVPFYPSAPLSIEKVGFLGLTWIFLFGMSLKDSKTRTFALIGGFFFWVALGPNFGLMSLLKEFPGFHGLRSIGRIQVLSTFFTLSGILLLLEKLPNRRQAVFLGLLVLELLPGERSQQMPIHPELFSSKRTEFEEQLSKIPSVQPLLILPDVKSDLQLALARTHLPILEGYSGRTPLNAQLLNQLSKEGINSESLKEKLIYSHAYTVVSIDSQITEQMAKFPFLRVDGCYSHMSFRPCLFQVVRELIQDRSPELYLDRDTHWEYRTNSRFPQAVLVADQSGVFNYESSGMCWLEERTHLWKFPSWRRVRPLSAVGIKKVRFEKGEIILAEESKQWIYRLPPQWRANKIYSLLCQSRAHGSDK